MPGGFSPQSPRHLRRLRAVAQAASAEPAQGKTLCALAGVEGPHREAALRSCLLEGLLALAPGKQDTGKPTTRWYVRPH
jgi:hypothetical protein